MSTQFIHVNPNQTTFESQIETLKDLGDDKVEMKYTIYNPSGNKGENVTTFRKEVVNYLETLKFMQF